MTVLADRTPPYLGKHVNDLAGNYLGVIQSHTPYGECTVHTTDGSRRTFPIDQLITAFSG